MLTLLLDRKAFTERVLSFIGTSRIRAYNTQGGSYRLEHVLEDVMRYAKYQEEDGIPYVYNQAAYGIAWSVKTGRINGTSHVALKNMPVRKLVQLVYDVNEHCAHMGEVPAYLMTNMK